MKASLEDISEVSQALDYIAEQTYSEEEREILLNLLEQKKYDIDLDELKTNFPGKRGVITRLRSIFQFAQKYQKDADLMEDLKTEIEYLISGLNGEDAGRFEL